jgi:PHP family Zn ribbon phosphoesterase
MCPSGSYAPSPGSATCFACAKGYDSAPAGDACYKSSDCAGAKASKKGGKRRLREESDSEMEEDSESMFSF